MDGHNSRLDTAEREMTEFENREYKLYKWEPREK